MGRKVPRALPAAVETLITREIRAVKREIEAYPDDASVWRVIPGLPNTGGTLALHLAGNLQHFFGAILGKDGYRRDRDAEFARRDVPRRELLEELDAAIASDVFILHLVSHLAYHLGQIDYHRRAVTGDARAIDAVSVRELPELS